MFWLKRKTYGPVAEIAANTLTELKYGDWRIQKRKAVRIKCLDECLGKTKAIPVESLTPGIIKFDGECTICGHPLLAEIIFG